MPTAGTTAAGVIIDYLIGIANSQLSKHETAADQLRLAPFTGLLMDANPHKPNRFTSPVVAFPTLPSPPAGTVVDPSKLTSSVTDLLANLNSSWMKDYLPEAFGEDVIQRFFDTDIDSDLNEIEDDLRAALVASIAALRSGLESAITSSQSALATNIAGLQPKIDAAIDAASGDASEIAWARARDQAAREAQRQENEVVADWASRGFPLPGGVLTAQQEAARQKVLEVSSAMAAEQAVKTQDMYVELAKMAIDSWLKAASLQLESEIKAYTVFEASRMKAAEMEMESYRERAKLAVASLGLRIDLSKAMGETAVRYRLGVTQAVNALVGAYAEMARVGADGQAKVADSQRAVLAAMGDYWRAALTAADITLRSDITNNQQDMEWAKSAADAYVRGASNTVQAATSAADVYARVAAMAMSGLNGVASVVSEG